ncbi:hypothetical protein D3C71_1884110 [compost metagenome]
MARRSLRQLLPGYFFFQNLGASPILSSASQHAVAPAARRALNQPTANHARGSRAATSRYSASATASSLNAPNAYCAGRRAFR